MVLRTVLTFYLKKMKKFLFFITASLLLTVAIPSANAQFFKFGVKGGLLVNTESLKFNNGASLFDEKSTLPGFELGLQTTISLPLVPIIIQPEFVYSRVSAKYSTGTQNFGDLKLRSNMFDIPILVGFEFSIFRIMLGPVFTFPTTDIVSMDNQNIKFAPRYKNFVMGYQAGVGVTLGRVTVDARYHGRFDSLTSDKIDAAGIPDVDVKTQRFAFSVGYTIFKIL